MQIDSVAHTATLTTLALFLSSSLTGIQGAPVGCPSSGEVDIMELLTYPCGRPNAASLKSLSRREMYFSMRLVHQQLKNTKESFKKKYRELKKLYLNKSNRLENQFRPDWLPHGQKEWYDRESVGVNETEKAHLILPKFQEALQRFAITFFELRKYELRTDQAMERIVAKRYAAMEQMFQKTRGVMCEVKSAMDNLGITAPRIHSNYLVTMQPRWKCSGDATAMVIQDGGILRVYDGFVNDWLAIFRLAMRRGKTTREPGSPGPGGMRTKISTKRKINEKRKQSRKKDTRRGRRLGNNKTKKFPNSSQRANGRGRLRGVGLRKKLNGNKHAETV